METKDKDPYSNHIGLLLKINPLNLSLVYNIKQSFHFIFYDTSLIPNKTPRFLDIKCTH